METNLREPTTVGAMLTEEFLKDLDMSQEHFGKQLGISRKVINQICLNKRRITVEEAVDMAILLNTDADFWIRVQANHDEWLARQQENERRAKGIRPLFVAHMP